MNTMSLKLEAVGYCLLPKCIIYGIKNTEVKDKDLAKSEVDMMRKDDKNKRLESLISLGVLAIGFVLIIYPLFKLHGMIQWPMTLAIICLAVIIVSIVLKAAITPLSTSASYIIGFFIAYIFQSDGTDPGGSRTNNLWIIWTVIIAVTAIVSSIYEFVRSRKTTR